MSIPVGVCLSIVAYRDFYDVPRLILAGDGRGFWIFDCPFDDGSDEYSPEYSVFYLGEELAEAERVLESWPRYQGRSVGSIEVGRVRFDESSRKQLTCI
jgi:hypothetical protein